MNLRNFFFLLILLKSIPSYAGQQDTVRLFYDINQKELSIQNKAKLDSLNKSLTGNTKIQVFGYADYPGKWDFNLLLSKQRAETVKSYLSGLNNGSIQIITEGKGAVKQIAKSRLGMGEPLNRRVDIIVPAKVVSQTAAKDPATIKKDKSVYTRMNSISTLNIGESVSFKELTFQPGRHFLTADALPYLDSLTAIMIRHPNLKIEIQGHICCELSHEDGTDRDTQRNELSLNRAKYVYNYLVSKGVDAERMRYRGLGSTDPKVFPEQTVADQNLNRRVQIVLLSK
jgi:outer membrane protein OmpA-like peptidoglycan-associated protein